MYEELRKNLEGAIKLYCYYLQRDKIGYIQPDMDKIIETVTNETETKILKNF